MSDLEYRRATRDDIAQVLANEVSAYAMPWGKQALIDSLNEQYEFFLILLQDKVIGHLILQVIVDECHLLNICLNPRFQGKGLGKQVMRYWFEFCESSSVKQLLLEVRASNQKAKALYQQCGFQQLSVRKAYYPLPDNQREDGIVMSRWLENPS